MKNIDLAKIKRAHFVGIGGIGVSAIARMMIGEGKIVSGSDSTDSLITKELKKLGAEVFIGHNAGNVSGSIDLLVYTPAVTEENPELKKAKELNIPTFSYPEILGLISQNKYTIAISGAHGKTTTTAMIGKILTDAKKDPTIIVGSLMNGSHSNFSAGKSDYFVVEACEYKKSFLNLSPRIIVITNIDNDHLDYYGSLENIKKAFAEFVSKLPEDGFLVCDPNDENLKEVIKSAKAGIIDYTKISSDFNLKIPGEHNIKNAKAAVVVAKILGIEEEMARESLNDFSGTWRRFEYKGKTKNGIVVYDDYGHHPTEIKATLKGARKFFGGEKPLGNARGKIWCVFQPHLYSRTKLLLEDFGKSFGDAGEVILADIYAAREPKDESINSKMLADEIIKNGGKATYLGSSEKIENFLLENAKKNDVVLTIGAGDIYKIGENLLK
ncbi:MAG: UDP-N-acetylmuramate--L-alanine ligase [Candidatus Pacebacteria bacterium]|nr:UDP-N-acetylmuramate--L-alanine ligase [Candidatus Paceibacterota bacterium]NUQ57345.1 UDP-N-acetylmuramate--L-alanine ligase [Candidatus Paceibacter sp.]